MIIRARLRLALALATLLTASSWLLGSPAASQEQLNDALNVDTAEQIDTLGIVPLGAAELAALRGGAVPNGEIDTWRAGSSAAETWTLSTAKNLAAQQTELIRLGLEAEASVGREEVSGWHYVAASNREKVVSDRLTALVVDSFVNGESDELDKLTGSQARTYVDAPIQVATETLTATRNRLSRVASAGEATVRARQDDSEQVRSHVRLQGYAVDEAFELDSTSRRLALQHPITLRTRRDQTLEVSGEAPETVQVGGFLVSPEIAGQLADMLAAAAEDEITLSGWGYRSTEEQIQLRINHCGETGFIIFDGRSPNCTPPTARPLHSQHELGLAIDFTENGEILNPSSPGFVWLQENAATYGFFNLPSEAWHWSTTGH
ncbi:MAG: M15 family metallopeptidase [Acidimicrobiales bacterium]